MPTRASQTVTLPKGRITKAQWRQTAQKLKALRAMQAKAFANNSFQDDETIKRILTTRY